MIEAALISAAVVLLQWMGRGALAAPPLTSLSGALRWADERDAATMAMVLLRLATLVLGYHVLATTALVVVGRVLHLRRLADRAEAVSLPPFRATAQRLIGLSMSISTLLAGPGPGASAGAAGGRPAVERVVVERIDQSTSSGPSPGDGTATLRVTPAPDPPAPVPHPTPASAAPAMPATYTVKPGDHLWSISEGTLARMLGRAPTDAEIDPYWRRVIAANPQFTDPDLIHPDDIVTIPPARIP